MMKLKKLKVVVCEQSIHGQSHSLLCGLSVAEDLRAEAVVIMLADQPNVSTKLINEIIAHATKNESLPFVGVTYQGVICPPVLFRAHMFVKLYELQGDVGARKIIRDELANGKLLEINDSDVLFDVDTEADYDKLLQKTREK